MALGAVEASATIVGLLRCMTIGTSRQAGDHHLLVVVGPPSPGGRDDKARLILLLERIGCGMAMTTVKVAMSAVIEAGMLQPRVGNIRRQKYWQITGFHCR